MSVWSWLLLAVLGAASSVEARTVGDRVASRSAEARALYDTGRYEEALRAYRDALVERPGSERLHLNVGDALFKLEDYEQALLEFERAAASDDPLLSASAHYNRGNTYFQLQDYPAAVEAYREALSRIPDDTDAKANLELALQRLAEPPPSGQSGGDEPREPEGEEGGGQPSPKPAAPDGPPPEEDEPPSESEGDDAQTSPEPSTGQAPEEQDGSSGAPQQETEMDADDAEQLLDALRGHEQEAQRRRYRVKGQGHAARDW